MGEVYIDVDEKNIDVWGFFSYGRAILVLYSTSCSFNLIVLLRRSLRPLDREAIVKSVKKTNRLVTVEEGWPQCGVRTFITCIICVKLREDDV